MSPIDLKRKISIFTLFILIILVFAPMEMMAEKDSMDELRDKLGSISQEEREILDSLFIQAQEIEELEREKSKILLDIKGMEDEIENMDGLIQEETKKYEAKLDLLEKVLKSYQRMGPGSYIEIILDADNINNLLKRINILRDLTKNTGELLTSIDELKEALILEKISLDEKLAYLEEKELELTRVIEEGEERLDELEESLAALEGDRGFYQERLDSIMLMMEELVELIGDATREFTYLIREGNLPEDRVEMKISGLGVRASIDEAVFNQVIKTNPNLPNMIIKFNEGFAEMELPENQLSLKGNFIILDGQTLQFQVEEGMFYGFLLKSSTIENFFEKGYFILDIEPLIGKNELRDVEIRGGYMELHVNLKFF